MNFVSLLFLFVFATFNGQQGFEVIDGKKSTIKFKLINNLIFIPVNINGTELTFLLDSGVNETILFSLENKSVNFNNVEKIKFSGLGESQDIEGLKADKNIFTIGKNYKDSHHTIYVILNENINFSSHIGIPVNGILGYHFFKDHPVEIDYIQKKITVYQDQNAIAKKLRKYEELPITIEGNKPYIIADVEMTHQRNPSKLLVDSGNSDAIWLFPKLISDFVYNRPNIDDYLGQGFNGDIFGKRSRIHRLYLGNFTFEKPLTAMPDEYSIQHLSLVPDRKGSIGSDILRRFTVVFNYPEKKIYFRKNRNYDEPFLFNSSGLDIMHDGMSWEKDLVRIETKKKESIESINVYSAEEGFRYNFVLRPTYSVAGCRKDSPCYIAGIRKGDKIISINNKNVGNFTLQKINDLLKNEDGTILHFRIEREGATTDHSVILKDPIPYQDEN